MYVRVIVDDVGPPCRCQGPTISVSPRRRVVVAKAYKILTALPPWTEPGSPRLHAKQSMGDV